jgi:hypothetical protein
MLHCTEIDEYWLLPCGAPARNFAGLAAQSEMERRGNRRGDRELFMGAARDRNGRAFTGFEEEDLQGGNGLRRDLRSREEEGGRGLAGRAHTSAREKGIGCTGSGSLLDGPRADSVTGPNRSLRPFSIFILFSSFSFSVFLFLSYIFQFGSKLIQTNFVNSLKFNSTIQNISKHVFRTKTRFLIKDLN